MLSTPNGSKWIQMGSNYRLLYCFCANSWNCSGIFLGYIEDMEVNSKLIIYIYIYHSPIYCKLFLRLLGLTIMTVLKLIPKPPIPPSLNADRQHSITSTPGCKQSRCWGINPTVAVLCETSMSAFDGACFVLILQVLTSNIQYLATGH